LDRWWPAKEGAAVLDVNWTRGLRDEVSIDRVMEVTGRLASWVRLSGSPAELEAFEYLREVLEGAGLPTELIFHDAYISLPGRASVVCGGDSYPAITHSFSAATPRDGVEAPVEDLGRSASPGPGSTEGKIALQDGLAMAGQVRITETAGAAGQIYVNGDLTYEMIVSSVWGSPGERERDLYPRTPIVSVTGEVGHRLRERLAAGDRHVRLLAEVATGWRKTPLLVADVRSARSEDFVLFSGHLDSWHFGAMDNAGANATMVEAGRIFAAVRERLQRGLRLAFWSGHSHGRYSGSAWYADNMWRQLREHCVAHVNIDSVGGKGATVLTEAIAMASTRELGAEAIRELSAQEFEGSRVGRAGDQSFVGLGVPSLWMGLSEQPPSDHVTARAFAGAVGSPRSGGLGWWWHTTEDTVDKLDPEFLLRDARIYVQALGRLLLEPLLPLDLVAEAGESRAVVCELAELSAGRVDLSSLCGLADEAVAAAQRLQNWRDERRESLPPEAAAAIFNQGAKELLRGLIGPSYSASGPFQQDLAGAVPPLPQLQPLRRLAAADPSSDEARVLRVDLVRARNRVEDALARGVEAARLALERLE
jgi:hypothetical protein